MYVSGFNNGIILIVEHILYSPLLLLSLQHDFVVMICTG